jgi:hypothetical protein
MDRKILVDKRLFSFPIFKKMCLKNSLRTFSTTLFLLCLFIQSNTFAQQGSIYLSVGYNQPWYAPTTIHIEQSDLGNSYDMLKVKGNNRTHTPISFLQLNYRFGFFYDEWQTNAVEISFDPLNYAIKDNQNFRIKGTINNIPGINRTQLISKKNGSYYYLNGANLMLINLVKRIEVFRKNSKDLRVDILLKGGAGPAFPHFENSLPINPVDDPQINWGGWNVGAEAGVRVTLYRYLYFECTGKYDYASFNEMRVFDGTAKQDLTSYAVIASIGFTLPTSRLNPLFHRDHRIVTMLPFYQHKDELGKKIDKKNKDKNAKSALDSLAIMGLVDIPEFQDILDRKYKKLHPDTLKKVPMDLLDKNVFLTLDSTGKVIGPDSLVQDSVVKSIDQAPEHMSRKERKRKKREEAKAKKEQELKEQELKNEEPKAPDAIVPPPPAEEPKVPEPQATTPVTPTTPVPEVKEPELSKKEQKKKEQEEREALKKKEQEEKEAQKKKNEEEREAQKKKIQDEREAQKKKNEEIAAQKKKDEEERAAQKNKDQEEKEAQKKKEQEERAAQKNKEQEEKEAQKKKDQEEREAQKKKDQEEREAQKKKDQEAKDEQRKTEAAGAKEEEKKETEQLTKEQRKKEKDEQYLQKLKEKQDKYEQKMKEKEEKKEKKRKEKEDKDKPESTENK